MQTVYSTCLYFQHVSSEEVKVSAYSIEEKAQMSTISIPMEQLKTLPVLAGEIDIVKAMQLLPGIKPGHEGTSAMYVRGGSHDQNLLLLDDVPLYNINHLGGFVSVFNPEAINSFTMYKGAFPARYGGRLSSVLDVRMKDGNMKKRHTQATLGMISCKLQTEGPIKRDTASYMISARRFMYDLISRPVSWLINDKRSSGYTFYDLNAKFNYKPTENDRLLLSFYSGDDKSFTKKTEKEGGGKTEMQNKAKWGNTLLALRWNRILRKDLFSNITANVTQYRYRSSFRYTDADEKSHEEYFKIEYNFYSKVNDFALKYDLSYFPFQNYNIRIRGGHTAHHFTPSHTAIYQSDSHFNTDELTKYRSTEHMGYIENELSLWNVIKVNPGIRAVLYDAGGKTYKSADPRMLLSINLPRLFAVKASFCRVHQYTHMLTYSGQGLPSDIWLPVTESIPPQQSEIQAFGIAKSVAHALELSIEVYRKEMSKLISYKEGAALIGSSFERWDEIIETGGKGYSKGLELLLQKKEGRARGWIAYTLSESTRQFDNINGGKTYPYIYDVKHDFSISGNYDIKRNLTLSATWLYMTGRALDYPNTMYRTSQIDLWDVSENPEINQWSVASNPAKNSLRMHPYHRLDLGLSYSKQKKKSKRIINLSLYNAYNRANPYYYYMDRKETKDEYGQSSGQSEKVIIQRSLFMIMPAISYTWVW